MTLLSDELNSSIARDTGTTVSWDRPRTNEELQTFISRRELALSEIDTQFFDF